MIISKINILFLNSNISEGRTLFHTENYKLSGNIIHLVVQLRCSIRPLQKITSFCYISSH